MPNENDSRLIDLWSRHQIVHAAHRAPGPCGNRFASVRRKCNGRIIKEVDDAVTVSREVIRGQISIIKDGHAISSLECLADREKLCGLMRIISRHIAIIDEQEDRSRSVCYIRWQKQPHPKGCRPIWTAHGDVHQLSDGIIKSGNCFGKGLVDGWRQYGSIHLFAKKAQKFWPSPNIPSVSSGHRRPVIERQGIGKVSAVDMN